MLQRWQTRIASQPMSEAFRAAPASPHCPLSALGRVANSSRVSVSSVWHDAEVYGGGKAVTGRAEEGVEEVCGGQREAGQVH